MVEPSKPSLFQVALSVLNEPDAVTKAQLTFSAAADYAAGLISLDLAPGCVPSAPDTPARPANVTLLEPRLVGAKNRKVGVRACACVTVCRQTVLRELFCASIRPNLFAFTR